MSQDSDRTSRLAPGYTVAELDCAQERFGLRFPPDLVDLLRDRRIPGGYDWTRDDDAIRDRLNWPRRTFCGSVERNAVWWPEWGTRPAMKEDRAAIVGRIVAQAPKLIPLFRHRFLPEEPFEAGNPVFSVMGLDVVHYGVDLNDYLQREFATAVACHREAPSGPKAVRFWSLVVDRAVKPPHREGDLTTG